MVVTNPKGIHARPSALIAKTAMQFSSEIVLIKDDVVADARNVMSLLMLSAAFGSVLKIRVSGEDEQEALSAIEKIFDIQFNDDDNKYYRSPGTKSRRKEK